MLLESLQLGFWPVPTVPVISLYLHFFRKDEPPQPTESQLVIWQGHTSNGHELETRTLPLHLVKLDLSPEKY